MSQWTLPCPPPNDRGWVNFFRMGVLSSATQKIFPQKDSDFVGDIHKDQKTCFSVFLLKRIFFTYHTFKINHSKGLTEDSNLHYNENYKFPKWVPTIVIKYPIFNYFSNILLKFFCRSYY